MSENKVVDPRLQVIARETADQYHSLKFRTVEQAIEAALVRYGEELRVKVMEIPCDDDPWDPNVQWNEGWKSGHDAMREEVLGLLPQAPSGDRSDPR